MIIKVSNLKIKIDNEDYKKFCIYKWSASKNGYVRTTNYYKNKKQKTKTLHRYIMNAKKGQIVDHIDGNKLNNSKKNLRFVNYFQNAQNRKGDSNKKYNLPKGVFLSGYKNKKYRVRVQTKYKGNYEGGYFSCIEDAVLKYNQLAKKVFGKYSRNSI